MNLNPITVNGVPAAEQVCDVCNGNTFQIVVIQGHTHFVCGNPICRETVCQISHSGCKPAESTEPKDDKCSYCGSGLIQNGECQECGL